MAEKKPDNKLACIVFGSLITLLIGASLHGMQKAYAVDTRVACLETMLPRIEQTISELSADVKSLLRK